MFKFPTRARDPFRTCHDPNFGRDPRVEKRWFRRLKIYIKEIKNFF